MLIPLCQLQIYLVPIRLIAIHMSIKVPSEHLIALVANGSRPQVLQTITLSILLSIQIAPSVLLVSGDPPSAQFIAVVSGASYLTNQYCVGSSWLERKLGVALKSSMQGTEALALTLA